MSKKASPNIVSHQAIERRILHIRGYRVMLDGDLAKLYGVSTKALNQAVKRNRLRFPGDFAFQLTAREAGLMRSHFVTASKRNIRYRPFAFTEHGALMLGNVLNSALAIQMSIFVVRTFIKLREMFSSQKELMQKLVELERKVSGHDKAIREIFEAIYQLMNPPRPTHAVGFYLDKD